MRECRIGGEHTIVDWYMFCREVCVHKGRRVEVVRVFGGIDRRTRECFLVPVEDRSAEMLIPIIKKWIKPGTKVMSDVGAGQGYSPIHQISCNSASKLHKLARHIYIGCLDKGNGIEVTLIKH